MGNSWVVDASPLIVLGKAEYLSLLPRLAERLVIPQSVLREVSAGPPGDAALVWLQGDGARWIEPDLISDASLMAWDLGAGETAVLAWAKRYPNFEVILDDRAARKCAEIFHIPVRGTLGIILAAKQRSLLPSAKLACDALLAAGLHLPANLIQAALRLVGE